VCVRVRVCVYMCVGANTPLFEVQVMHLFQYVFAINLFDDARDILTVRSHFRHSRHLRRDLKNSTVDSKLVEDFCQSTVDMD
jgi:hypothetical protein